MSSIHYLVFDDAGRILQIGTAPESLLELQASPGRNILRGTADLRNDYVVNGVVTPKPVCPATLSGYTLSNVPVPAKVQINRTVYDTNSATVELDLPYPGTYKVKVMAFPYLDGLFEVVKA